MAIEAETLSFPQDSVETDMSGNTITVRTGTVTEVRMRLLSG